MAYFDLNAYLKALYSKDLYEQILSSFERPKELCVFLNALKCDDKSLEELFKKEGFAFLRLDEFCYKLAFEDKSRLTRLKDYNLGHFYLQNHSSYLAAKNLNVRANERVLDLCAAPGGKSINLANFMSKLGVLSCVEVSKDRFFLLKENLKKHSVDNARCFNKDGKIIGKLCTLSFDKILVDAPCSSFAKLGFKAQKSYKEIKSLALLQKKLLHSALNALKIGGELVYSTCTFLKEENEEVIENALNSKFKLKMMPLNLDKAQGINAFSSNEDLANFARRIVSDELHQGFFIARLKKLG